MPIEVKWSNRYESTLEFSPLAPFEWEMMYPAIDEIVRLAGTRTDPIVLLITPGNLHMPNEGNPLRYVGHFFRVLPENIRLVIVDMRYQSYFELQVMRIVGAMRFTKHPIRVAKSDQEIEAAINA